MKRTRTAGGVVINVNSGHVLVVSQNGDSWSLPKGHLEKGEGDLEAAEREIEEESGIARLTFVRELGSYERHGIGYGGKGERTDEMKTIVMFLFTTPQDDLRPIDPKNPEARWVPKEEVAALLTHEKDKAFFLSVLPSLR